MTVGSAPTATAVRSPRPGPIRRIGLAAVVVLGPLSITILSANPAYQSADDATTIAAKETSAVASCAMPLNGPRTRSH
jgi:hypothetical protein